MTPSADTICGLFDAVAARQPESEAAVFPDSRATYAELRAASVIRAQALRAAGIGRGDLVGLLVAPNAANVDLLLGIWRLGAIPVPINARYKSSELRYVVEHSGMALLLCDPDVTALVEQASVDCRVVVVGEAGEFMAAAERVDAVEVERLAGRVAPQDDALLLYTSGTTSKPKGTLDTHASLVAEGRHLAE